MLLVDRHQKNNAYYGRTNNVFPDFWKEVDAATAENDDLLEKVFERDPSFTL